MFNMTKVEFELISDSNMYIFFGKGTRGGVSYISNRYSKSSNKYLKFYDPKQKSNTLYTQTQMPKFLATSGFKQIDLKGIDLNNHSSNSSR